MLPYRLTYPRIELIFWIAIATINSCGKASTYCTCIFDLLFRSTRQAMKGTIRLQSRASYWRILPGLPSIIGFQTCFREEIIAQEIWTFRFVLVSSCDFHLPIICCGSIECRYLQSSYLVRATGIASKWTMRRARETTDFGCWYPILSTSTSALAANWKTSAAVDIF